jgi:probable rRNA maturation factor
LVTLEVEGAANVVDVESLQALAAQVMEGESVAQDRALAVLLTEDAELRRLNREFRDVDEATDVLSFPDESTEEFVGGSGALGDIAISLETATRRAAAANRPTDREISHLLVHGILHLCGYDHELGRDEAERMRQREEHYLGDLSEFHDSDEAY